MKKMILCLITLVATCAGCSSYDQSRMDGIAESKRNHSQDVQRALTGDLTEVEFRSSLQSFDVQALEEAAKKKGADLESLRKALKAETDEIVSTTKGLKGRSVPDTGSGG